MNNPVDLEQLERQAWRYDAQDGIMEFLVGVLFFFSARTMVEPRLTVFLVLALFPLRWVWKICKERFTYPRIGYVKLKSENDAELGKGMLRYLLVIFGIQVAGLWIFGDITSWTLWLKWLPALMGGFTSGAFFYAAGKSGLIRHYGLAALSVGWGVACALMPDVTRLMGVHRWALGLGLVCLVTGALNFAMFMRAHPVRDPEVGDGHA